MFKKSASRLFGLLTAARNGCYDVGFFKSYKSPLKVISIGNIQVGGSGKTPLTILLARELNTRGSNPVILSRGYGARINKPFLVNGGMSPVSCGDEALLMAAQACVPVVVSPDRVAGVEFIAAQQLGNVILLDDGLQHRRLQRDMEIIVVNVGSVTARRDFIENRLLPFGSLREDRDSALKRADLVVLSQRAPSGNGADDQELLSLIPKRIPLFKSFFQGVDVVELSSGSALTPCEVVAFCGIANPEAFIDTLNFMNFTVHQRACWPDHYAFTKRDIVAMRKRYPAHALVCTEKDGVRIPAEERSGVYVLRGASKVVPHDAFIMQVLKSI